MPRTIAEENSMLGAYNWKISRGDESGTKLQGYVKPQYTKPGLTISFHASTELDDCQFFLRIYRLGWYRGAGARQVHRSKIISVGNNGIWSKDKGWQHNEKCGDAIVGMDWPRVYQLYIPDDWLSGSYIAKFETLDGRSYIHPFWVSTTGKTEAKIAVLGAVITSQARNWWGGFSATQVVGGEAFISKKLYYPVGSEVLSFERPYFNSRGGDALRWEYPLVRWLEKNQLNVAYHTDLELETKPELLSNYAYVITAGPMRYWTKKTEEALQGYVEQGGNIVHLGSEAGHHIVDLRNNNDYNDGQIVLQPQENHPHVGERLKNNFFSATVSGSRNKAPWAELKFNNQIRKIIPDLDLTSNIIEGIAGLSWDKSIKQRGLKVLAKNKILHRKRTYRVANSHIRNFPSGGSIFNAGVSSWTWGLEEFGNHGNTHVSKDLQKITLGLIGLDPNREVEDLLESFEDDSQLDGDLFSLDDFNVILQNNPRNFDALIGAGIMLSEEGKFNEAHTYFERAFQVRPESLIANYRMARNHHKLKQFDEMLPLYETLLSHESSREHYHVQYADLLINLGRFEEAIQKITQLISKDKENATFFAMLAQCQRRLLLFGDAEENCLRSLEIDSTNVRALLQYASISHDKKEFLIAEKRWEMLLKYQPNNYTALIGVSRGAFKRRDYSKGREILEHLINDDLHRFRITPYIDLMNMTFNYDKDYSNTVEICDLLLDNIGTNMLEHKRLEHVVICHKTLSLSKLGLFDDAIGILNRYSLENPENDEYKICLSQVFRDKGDHELSFKSFASIYTDSMENISPIHLKQETGRICVENLESKPINFVENEPLVSVIMTAYKATKLIEIAVQSILNQSYRNIELIIVDDASPDETFEYIQNLSSLDSRIKPIKLSKNGGTYVAKNRGLEQAEGKYVAFHDSDDWCHQDKIKLQVERLESNEEIVGVTTSYIRVDEHSNIIYRGKGAIRHACISLMVRRELVMNRVGYFDSVRISADSEFEMRISTVFGKESIEHIRIPMIIASVRSESLSQGGKFVLDWAGISGPRLKYRQSFDAYHNRILHGLEDGYMPFPLKDRKFDAPSDIIW